MGPHRRIRGISLGQYFRLWSAAWGPAHIQKFLEVDYLSPQEALSVANFSLDILIAYKIENINPNDHVKNCVIDYTRYLSGEEPAKEIIELLNNNSPRPVPIISPLELLKLTTDEVEHFFKKIIILDYSISNAMKDELTSMIVIALNQCQYELAALGLYLTKKMEAEPLFFSKYEIQALVQAKKYLSTCMHCIDSKKLNWWSKISGALNGTVDRI